MQKDYVTERLNFLTEFFKLCWLSIFAVGGASVSILLVGPWDRWRYAWASAGFGVGLLLLVVLWHTHRQMLRLWAELQKGDIS
ncbi:MAG: hypothetical protein ACRERD_31445 [Candidatus Binatia bacterium]